MLKNGRLDMYFFAKLEKICMRWRAEKLKNVDSWFDFWDKSDPYLRFLKIRNDDTNIEVQRSEIIQDELNPTWEMVEIPTAKLINSKKGGFRYKISHLESKFGLMKKMRMIG